MELLHHGFVKSRRTQAVKARCVSAWNEGEAMHAEWPSRMANDNGRSPLLPDAFAVSRANPPPIANGAGSPLGGPPWIGPACRLRCWPPIGDFRNRGIKNPDNCGRQPFRDGGIDRFLPNGLEHLEPPRYRVTGHLGTLLLLRMRCLGTIASSTKVSMEFLLRASIFFFFFTCNVDRRNRIYLSWFYYLWRNIGIQNLILRVGFYLISVCAIKRYGLKVSYVSFASSFLLSTIEIVLE